MAAGTAGVAAEVLAPPTAQTVGNAFVTQYYQILHHLPSKVHKFYQDISQLGRPEEDGTTSITTTMTAINEKFLSLKYDEYKAAIKSVDAQESLSSGVHVLVTGYMTGPDNIERNFTQSFFLAPQNRGGYFVLNDMFRYVDKVSIPEGKNQVLLEEVEIPITTEQVITEVAPVESDHIIEQTNGVAEEANGEVHIPFENGKIVDAKEEQEEEPVAEVVNAVPDNSQLVVETNVKTEEAPKKSFASIVKDLKGNSLPFSSPPPVPRKTLSKSQEQKANHAPPTVSSAEVSGAPESGKSQDGEGEGYSIYIKGLPYDVTPALLEDEFKKFGTIKNGGIQFSSKQGFCFGFVEFEEASSVQDAVKMAATEGMAATGGSAKWTDELHSLFCELCSVEVIKGNKVGTTLNKEGWNTVHKEFRRQKKKVSYSIRQFKNHWDAMKADYQLFKKLKFGEESGLGWNESTRTIEASSTWWAGKIQENPKYGKFRNKDLSLYMRYYDNLFGDIVATGERAKAANTYSAVNLEEGHEFTEVLGEDDDGKEGSGDSDDNNAQTPSNLFPSSLKSGRSSGSKRKQSGAESLRAGLDGLVAAISCRSTSSTAATEEATLNQAVDLLDAMEQVQCGTDLYFYARRYLLDKGNRTLFLKARNDEIRYGELMYNFTRAGRHRGGQ